MIITDEQLLRVKCVDVLPEDIGALREQLESELSRSASLGRVGIGLSLPQIGINKNMAIIRVDKNHSVDLVNCRITAGYDKEIFDQEGCLSFPDRYERTLRYQEILIEGNAVYPHRFGCSGLMAVVVQHEKNHMEGILLPDVALPPAKPSKNKAGPNDQCSCGSKKKYKKCCGARVGHTENLKV